MNLDQLDIAYYQNLFKKNNTHIIENKLPQEEIYKDEKKLAKDIKNILNELKIELDKYIKDTFNRLISNPPLYFNKKFLQDKNFYKMIKDDKLKVLNLSNESNKIKTDIQNIVATHYSLISVLIDNVMWQAYLKGKKVEVDNLYDKISIMFMPEVNVDRKKVVNRDYYGDSQIDRLDNFNANMQIYFKELYVNDINKDYDIDNFLDDIEKDTDPERDNPSDSAIIPIILGSMGLYFMFNEGKTDFFGNNIYNNDTNQGVFEGIERVEVVDNRTCPICLSTNGDIYYYNKSPYVYDAPDLPIHPRGRGVYDGIVANKVYDKYETPLKNRPVPVGDSSYEWLGGRTLLQLQKQLGKKKGKMYYTLYKQNPDLAKNVFKDLALTLKQLYKKPEIKALYKQFGWKAP